MHRNTLYKLSAAGVIPAYRIGGRLKYDPMEIELCLERNRVEATANQSLQKKRKSAQALSPETNYGSNSRYSK